MSNHDANPISNRYGSSSSLSLQYVNDVIASQLAHKSVRSYSDKPVPRELLQTLIAAAQSAATSSNLQTWSVIAVESQEARDKLAVLAGNQLHIRQAPLLLVWVADLSRAQRVAERQSVELAALEHFDSLLVSTVDAALAAQNAVVALESLGLSSVYIGALRNDLAAVAELLGLPDYTYPVFGLVVGYAADETAQVKPRLPLHAVLHYEKYSAAEEVEHIQAYDQQLTRFYQQQQIPGSTWSDLIVRRLASRTNLSGRERIPAVLKQRRLSLE